MPRNDAVSDYRARAEHDFSALSDALRRAGHPAPTGDPLSGVLVLLGQPAGPRAFDALDRSLETIGLPNACVLVCGTGSLGRALWISDPHLLIAVGRDSAEEIDRLDHPLSSRPFSGTAEGSLFAWKRATTGLLLPPLALALDDETEKLRFWRAFLTLKPLA